MVHYVISVAPKSFSPTNDQSHNNQGKISYFPHILFFNIICHRPEDKVIFSTTSLPSLRIFVLCFGFSGTLCLWFNFSWKIMKYSLGFILIICYEVCATFYFIYYFLKIFSMIFRKLIQFLKVSDWLNLSAAVLQIHLMYVYNIHTRSLGCIIYNRVFI